MGVLQSEIYKMTVRLREQQQKLQDDKIYLAESIADISHQIRTPLTSVNLLVSFLSEADLSDAKRRKFSQELYDQLSRIEWLITALLKISRLDAGIVQFNERGSGFFRACKASGGAAADSVRAQGTDAFGGNRRGFFRRYRMDM